MVTKEFKQKQINEATRRLEMLKGLHLNVLKDWKKDQTVNVSERQTLGNMTMGMLFWANDGQKKLIEKFEEKWDAVVYHCTHEYTIFGELLDMFYVSKHEEEWERDRDELADGYLIAYCENLSDPWCSEIGSIRFGVSGGGLIRVE